MYKESLNGKKLRNAAKYMPSLLLIAVMIGGNDQMMEGQTRNLREAIRVYQLLLLVIYTGTWSRSRNRGNRVIKVKKIVQWENETSYSRGTFSLDKGTVTEKERLCKQRHEEDFIFVP